MVNDNRTSCDMVVEQGRCKPQVQVTQEDEVYFRTILLGRLEVREGRVVFNSEDRDYSVVQFGHSEITYVDDVFGAGNRNKVIGRVARENKCNAYSLGQISYVRGQSGSQGFSVECTPFQVYRVEPHSVELS